jgi:hypothetical protein
MLYAWVQQHTLEATTLTTARTITTTTTTTTTTPKPQNPSMMKNFRMKNIKSLKK